MKDPFHDAFIQMISHYTDIFKAMYLKEVDARIEAEQKFRDAQSYLEILKSKELKCTCGGSVLKQSEERMAKHL